MNNKSIVKKFVSKIQNMPAPGVYSDTKGQDAVEWIAMAIAVLIAIGFFASIIGGIISGKTGEIEGHFPQ